MVAVVMTGGVVVASVAGTDAVVVGAGGAGCGAAVTCTMGVGAADETAVLTLRGGR